jgi:hypothetical protein
MKRHTFAVALALFTLIVIGGLLPFSSSHATGPISIAPSQSARFPVRRGNIPSVPFSGIVEGTVIATSTTSITIDKRIYRGKNISSAEVIFALVSDVRINADQETYTTSTMADISIGASVSLVIERVGKDAGKVREIRLHPGLYPHSL